MHTKKITLLFFQKIIKCTRKIYLKKIFKILITYFNNNINYQENISNNKNKILRSPTITAKKIKKFKVHNSKNIKFELMTKKVGIQKKGGYEKIMEYQKKEKEKEMEKLKQTTNLANTNFIKEKMKRLDSLNRKEKKYLLKIKERKKKLQNEINIFRKNTNISEETLSQIKQNNFSDKDSSFFSKISSNGLGSYDLKLNASRNKNLSEVLSSNESKSIISAVESKFKLNDSNKVNEDDIYSIKSNETTKSPEKNKEIHPDWVRQSVRNLQKYNLEKVDSKKNVRSSLKLKEHNN